jgi:hypothetical protein
MRDRKEKRCENSILLRERERRKSKGIWEETLKVNYPL